MESNPAQELGTYEARTAQKMKCFHCGKEPGRNSHVKVIALSKIDKGRAQVVFSASYLTAAIYAGRDRWLAGSRMCRVSQFLFLWQKESLRFGVRATSRVQLKLC